VSYAALWCKSNASFLEGASHPDELVERAHALGLRALALTDRDGVPGIVRAHVQAQKLGCALIVGSQVTLEDGCSLVLLARERAGYANLCALVSRGRLRSPKGESRVSWDEVCEHAPGLIALAGGAAAGGALLRAVEERGRLGALRDAFGEHLFALCARHRRAAEVQDERRVRALCQQQGLPLVACNEVLYHVPARRRVQDVLTCIRHGRALASAGTLLAPNAEHELKTPAAFAELFADDPLALARTRELAERCTFSLADLRYRYPLEKLPDGQSAFAWLEQLVYAGARARYARRGPDPSALGQASAQVSVHVREQLAKELKLIAALDYSGYFLTMHEIVEYCRSADIYCQGRGSAANSAVCYCLGITAIDPVRMGLLFERFISLERAEPPDIDLDIEHERREQVIQHVYEKHGRTHAAMVANVIRYRAKSALRDVGKALGFAQSDLLRASELCSSWGTLEEDSLRAAGLDARSRPYRLLLELARELEGFPRHLSIHPGGFLLGHEPIATLVPIENASMRGRTVIQWDKEDVEALGLFKVDLLALGALTHLHRSLDLLRARGTELSLATIPPEDAATYEQVSRGDTVGVFQIESRAQMAMLPRLRPCTYYDLVIEISLVRPGPITGGMVHPYLRRRRGLEPVDYPHPSLEPVLAKTLGVPLFQEQVMRIAVLAADYTPGEADQLRRDMAAWRIAGRIEQHRERLIGRMRAKGIEPAFAERVFEQIRGFGEYGFPESHAASFALISYASAWLRCHHLPEFTCGLLNSLPMGFYSASTIVEDAKRHELEFRPIDVACSAWDCTLEGDAVRMGLRLVKRLRRASAERIVAARASAAFASLADLRRRAQLAAVELEALAESGALGALAQERRAGLWLARAAGATGATGAADAPGLFDAQEDEERAPAFAPLSRAEEVAWDQLSSRHSTRGHPLAALRAELSARRLPDARAVQGFADGQRARYAGIVICRQRPATASGITFMTLEDETGFVNLVVHEAVYERHKLLARTQGFLGVSGRIQREGEVVHLIARALWVPPLAEPLVDLGSRDFH
jgi:error-prone DNA polymerase